MNEEVRVEVAKKPVYSDTEDKIRDIARRQYNVPLEEVTLETKFKEDLQGDSLDAIEMVMEVEDEFNICLPDEVAEKFKTVNDVVEEVNNRRANCGD